MLLRKRKPAPPQAVYTDRLLALPVTGLAASLVRWSLFNLILVALLGLLLRTVPLHDHFPLQYKNVLHGHSHVAFGGWIMPLLVALLLQTFPDLAQAVAYRHWRNIAALLLLSAYGMLLSFPVQGYAAVSIVFSTLSLGASCCLAMVVWRALPHLPYNRAYPFLKWGLFYAVLSALGPLATGPIIATGHQGTPLYSNAIYFYLHFTYNGLFVFAVLALWYGRLPDRQKTSADKVLFFLNAACIPAYALSLLWNKPPLLFYGIGGAAGLLQLVAVYYLLRDANLLLQARGWVRVLLALALASFVFKNLLQALSALPPAAAHAALHRNLVIAYLHLVLVGFVSLGMLAQAMQLFHIKMNRMLSVGLWLFIVSFTATELLLAANGWGSTVPYQQHWLALLVLGMLLGAIIFWQKAKPFPATNGAQQNYP